MSARQSSVPTQSLQKQIPKIPQKPARVLSRRLWKKILRVLTATQPPKTGSAARAAEAVSKAAHAGRRMRNGPLLSKTTTVLSIQKVKPKRINSPTTGKKGILMGGSNGHP